MVAGSSPAGPTNPSTFCGSPPTTKPWDRASIDRTADFIWRAHHERRRFKNLPPDIAPASVDQAYDVQEAFHRRLRPVLGPIGGLQIAITTKVMQQVMGIDHPCGGAVFASRIHPSPAELRLSDYIHVVAECELAVRLGSDLDDAGAVSPEGAMEAMAEAATAFELVEDCHADYRETKALTLIADNAWNVGMRRAAGACCRPAWS